MSVPSDVAVRGQAAKDANFNLGSDQVVYQVRVGTAGTYNVSVSLNYQTIAHGYLQDLYRDGQLQQVKAFKKLYDMQSLKHEQIASAQTVVASAMSAVPVVDLSASRLTIDPGKATKLSWTSTDATSCTASGAWRGVRDTSGYQWVKPAVSSTYTLTCVGDGGSARDSVKVTVK